MLIANGWIAKRLQQRGVFQNHLCPQRQFRPNEFGLTFLDNNVG
jgi:hypothetical protein